MEILVEWPPNIKQIRARFNLEGKIPVFAYGDKLYNPFGKPLPQDLLIHEETHSKQQRDHPGGVEGWWQKYLTDNDFVLSQEIQAYREQYKYIKETESRPVRKYMLKAFANNLSGSLYGNIIDFETAFRLIEESN